MTYKILFFLVSLYTNCCFGQLKKVNPFFCGKWINTHYENVLKTSADKYAAGAITPHYFLIDSSGLCTIYTKPEHKSQAGRPTRERFFGEGIRQLTYKHWGEMYMTQVLKSDSLIVISARNNGMSILFRKVNNL